MKQKKKNSLKIDNPFENLTEVNIIAIKLQKKSKNVIQYVAEFDKISRIPKDNEY